MADNNLAPRSKNKLPWYERALPMEGRATFLPYQDTLPGSVMNQRSFALPGIIAGAANALTAPGRAYSGSDQSFDPAAEAANFAMTMGGGGMGASRLAPAPRNALGMNVYQGSPHRFPPTAKNPLGEFDASKIGTGEGAQAYGHGHYSAEAKDLAKSYQKDLSARPDASSSLYYKGKEIEELSNSWQNQDINSFAIRALQDIPAGMGADQKAEFVTKAVRRRFPDAPLAWEDKVSEAARSIDANSGQIVRGNLYIIDLPDEHIAKMLDWDKPLSEQPHILKSIEGSKFEPFKYNSKISGRDFANQVGVQYPHNAEQLKNLGITGIRYLDAGSRGAGEGTSNFVVFPGNEDMMRIINRE